ncbi:MAG: DUF4352 domain-containing protein [Anaerolineales bacterium]|nr:DUF4352 domain-containing protein [Anaerolineales bacterium]
MSDDQAQNPIQRFVAERGLVVLVALAAIGLVMICIFGILLLRSLDGNGDPVVDEANGSPTPFPTAAGDLGTAGSDALIVGVSESARVTVTLDAPTSLQVMDRRFPVQTQVLPADGLWSAAGIGEGTAVWVYGSIINYVLGLPESDANRDLLEQMVPGNEMRLTTRSGVSHTFVFDSRQLVAVNNREVFAQTTPGLTLALLSGEGDERLVVHGTYVVPDTTNGGGGGLFELGETAQLGDVQLTVSGAVYLPDRPEVPSGFAFFIVDYQIQNIGTAPIDTGSLQLTLSDDLGNRYALSPVASSQLGTHPPLTGFLNAGQSASASIGFQIPLGLQSATLNFTVSQQGDASQLIFSLPFPGGAQAAAGTTVTLEGVEVSADGTSLVLRGQVTNLGSQPVVVTESAVTLKTSDGAAYLLLSTNPPFPWSVGAGQAVTFVVTVQRPLTADTAVFTVLNQPFQLSGLR